MLKHRLHLSIVAIASSLAFAACNDMAVEEIPVLEMRDVGIVEMQPFAGDIAEAGQQYMLDQRAIFGLSEDDEFTIRSVRDNRPRLSHIRLDQTHQGIRVWGADVVVHALPGVIQSVGGNVVSGLKGFDTTATLDAAEALAIAKAVYAGKASAGESLAYHRESTELVVFAHRKAPRLAWHVHFFTEVQAGLEPGRWNTFVDARSGEVLAVYNWLTTMPAQASGPGGNPNIARTWTDELDVVPGGNPGPFEMDTTGDPDIGLTSVHGLITEDWNSGTNQGNADVVSGPLDPIGDAAVNDAHGFTESALNMMWNWTGHDSIDDNGYAIRSRVHYSNNFENAFWDGSQMTYGDGDTYFYPLSGDIDVIAHEINHGYTEFNSNLIYSGQSGGLNESFSDVAGTAAAYYHDPARADFDIGTDIAQPGQLPGNALRFMCDPPADGVSIDTMLDFTGDIDVHYSSGIANKAFCLASRRLSDPVNYNPNTTATPAGVREATQAWYEANANYWTASTSFYQACRGILDAAQSLSFAQGAIDAIRDSWADVDVHCAGTIPPAQCNTTETAASGTITSPSYPGNYPNNANQRTCIVPNNGCEVTVTFTDFLTETDYDYVEVLDTSTGLSLSYTSGSTAPPDATASSLLIHFVSDVSVRRRGYSLDWTTNCVNNPPVADFTYVATDLSVAFTDTSTDSDGFIVSWDWDFGDGNLSTVQNPNHVYAAGGTYSVTLTVTDDQGATDSVTMPVTVVAPNIPPNADFTYVATDLSVAFTDTSSDPDGTIASWDWNFGDGNTSTAQNPNHVYAAGGTYSVSLTVTDDRGGTDTAIMDVTVIPANVDPTADFTYVVTDLSVAFTDTSSDPDGNIVSWEWDFGDGNTATDQNPNHTYAAGGTYSVSLTVTDDRGGTDTATMDVTVMEAGDPDAGPGDPDAGPGDPDAGPGTPDAGPGTPDAGEPGRPSGGCCDSGGQDKAPWSALIVIFGILFMRRRKFA